MLESKSMPEGNDLSRLHAATCLSMTRFIHGHQCPKLAHQIVHQLNQLIAHPQLDRVNPTRDMYLQLLEHWQKITEQLLEKRDSRKSDIVYH